MTAEEIKDKAKALCEQRDTEGVLALLPDDIGTSKRFIDRFRLNIRRHSGTIYQVAYGNEFGSSGEWHDMINSSERDTLAEAACDMVCWLADNGYIKGA